MSKWVEIPFSEMVKVLYEGEAPPLSVDVGMDRLQEAIAELKDRSNSLLTPTNSARIVNFTEDPQGWTDPTGICRVEGGVPKGLEGQPADYLEHAPDARRLLDWLLNRLSSDGNDVQEVRLSL